MRSPVLPLDALVALASAGERPSLFAGEPMLRVDLDAAVPAIDCAPVCAWLRQAACPVLGIGDPAASPDLAAACDVICANLDQAEVLAETVMRHPLAASLLVQLLRHTEGLALESALFAESLAYASLQAGRDYQDWLASHRAPSPRRPLETGPAVDLQQRGTQWRMRLERPSTRNAMSVEMRDALLAALGQVAASPHPVDLIIDASGPHFSTGGELSEFGTVADPPTGHLVRQIALPGRALAALAARAVVRVHGACVGSGIEFPAFAGRIEARADAVFTLPELGFGLIPGAGGCVSIPRRIGRQRMAAWALSGATIDARTALEWGLVDAVVEAWAD